MYDLGDIVPLSVSIVDAEGQPANAGSVSVTVTALIDGTPTTSGAIAPTSVGVYDYDFTTVKPGIHNVRWVATGTNAAVYADVFDVQPVDPAAFISLADVKTHMKKTGTADDEELRWFVAAACQLIRERMGDVIPTTVTEDVPAGCKTIVLRRRPVMSVTSVLTLPGLQAIPEANEVTGADGWKLNAGPGVLTHTRCFPSRARILYRVGRAPLAANFRLAGLELSAHLWLSRKMNAGGGRPSLNQDQPVMAGSAFALPIRVRELLGLGRDDRSEDVMVS